MMSTVIDNQLAAPQSGAPMGSPTITAHAQVRFIERYVDAKAVVKARQATTSESAALAVLGREYAADLVAFRRGVELMISRLKARFGHLPFPRFSIEVGGARVVVVGDSCITTLPPRAQGRPIRDRHPANGRRGRIARHNTWQGGFHSTAPTK